jgi:hypothetical protein
VYGAAAGAALGEGYGDSTATKSTSSTGYGESTTSTTATGYGAEETKAPTPAPTPPPTRSPTPAIPTLRGWALFQITAKGGTWKPFGYIDMGECSGLTGPCITGRCNSLTCTENKMYSGSDPGIYGIDYYTRNKCAKLQDAIQCMRTYATENFEKSKQIISGAALTWPRDFDLVTSPAKLKTYAKGRYYKSFYNEVTPSPLCLGGVNEVLLTLTRWQYGELKPSFKGWCKALGRVGR